jgi:predicted GNAT family acetyltransferase
MSALFQELSSRPEPLLPSTGPEDTWATNHDVRVASYRHTINEGLSISDQLAWGNKLDERTEKIRTLTGSVQEYMTNYPTRTQAKAYRSLIDSGDILIADDGSPQAATVRGELLNHNAMMRNQIQAMVAIDRLAQQYPDQVLTDEQLETAMTAELATKRNENFEVLSRAKGFGGVVAQLTGAAGAAFMDPAILVTLPFGIAPGVTKGLSLLSAAGKVAIREAELAFASEVFIQERVFKFKDMIGSPYTFKDAAYSVLAATLGTAVLAPSISTGMQLAARYRSNVKLGRIESSTRADEAATLLENLGFIERDRPPSLDAERHAENVNAAVRDLNEGKMPDVSEVAVHQVDEAKKQVVAVVDELTPPVAKARADVPMTLREFDGEVNVIHPAIEAPVVTARIRGGDTLQVINTAVPASMQRQGIASAAFVRLADEAQARGLELVSDTKVSEVAQAVIENLRSKGYKIEKNPNAEKVGNSLETTDGQPLYRIAKEKPAEPSLPAAKTVAKKQDLKKVDASTDTLTQAIAKLGGLDADEAIAQGIDPAIFQNISRTKQKNGGGTRKVTVPAPENMPLGIKGGRLFKKGGKTFDEMRELLAERGYVGDDLNELLDKLNSELSGEKQFSKFADLDKAMGDKEARLKEAAESMGDDTMGNAQAKVALAQQRLAEYDVMVDIGTADEPKLVSGREVFRELEKEQDALTLVEACVRGGNVT